MRKKSVYKRGNQILPNNNDNSALKLNPVKTEISSNTFSSAISAALQEKRKSLGSIIEEEVDSDGDNDGETTTFQRQCSTFRASVGNKNNHSFMDEKDAFMNRKTSKNEQPRSSFNRMQSLTDMQNRANSVLSKLSQVFGHGNNMDADQLLKEAQADQKFKKLKRNSRIIIQITRDNQAVLPPLLLHPEAPTRAYWDVFMLLLVCYYALVTPINISFDESPFDLPTLDIIFNMFFIIDIILQFFTSYKHEKGPNAGRLEVKHRIIIMNYLKKWFFIDFMASFPLGWVIQTTTGNAAGGSLNKLLRLVRSVKLMRILRMSRIWKRLLHKVKINPSVVRLFKLFGFLIIEWHWIGCMYWAIAVSEGFDEFEDPNAWTPTYDTLAMGFPSQYIRAYFWAVMVTTGVGKDIIPNTDIQYLFTTCAIIVGVLMYAVIVGSVGSALQSIDTPDSQRRRRIEAVREYLRQRDVTEELTEKILNYYDYCYTRHITEHDDKVLTEIHSALKEKLDLEVNQQLLTKVPRFKQLPDGLLLVLIHSMVSRIYLPNELVYLIGEKSQEMFFIVRGDIEKLDRFGRTQEFLSDGECFGDQLFKPNARRDCTIRCITHCELLILTKTALRKIMKHFPEFAMLVQKWQGENRYQSKHGWERVRYVVKTLRYMKIWGAKEIKFMDVVNHLNGELMESQKKMLQRRKSIKNCEENQQIREMTDEDFHHQMATTFDVFDHLLPKSSDQKNCENNQKIQKETSIEKVSKFFGDATKIKQRSPSKELESIESESSNSQNDENDTQCSSPFVHSEV